MDNFICRVWVRANIGAHIDIFCNRICKREVCAGRIFPAVEGITRRDVDVRLFKRSAIIDNLVRRFAINYNANFYAII